MNVFLWNARARISQVEATLNHPFAAQVPPSTPCAAANIVILPPLAQGSVANRADFINTQAIYARVLTHTTAYPGISHAVGELFSDVQGSASVDLVFATAFVPLDVPVAFGVVQQRVMLGLEDTLYEKEHPGGVTSSICVGILTGDDDHLIFAPSVEETHAYKANDRLVLITRDVPPPDH